MDLLLGSIGAYLLGSIPFAYLLVRVCVGVDVRTVGSGNSGATNASRAFQPPWRIPVFLLIYLLDFAKGFLPTWLASAHFAGPLGDGSTAYGPVVLIGAATVLGHCTSPFLKFKGGKGVATTTGVFAFLEPLVLVLALAIFFLLRGLTKQVFLGSLAIGVVLAAGVIVREPATAFGERWPVTVFALVITLFLVYTHRSNIRNYWENGTDEDD
ncbi:MAG: glycerol-3-phosphate 1-O-acyltransferase PlsY [Planctomycetota bacterium]|jgi:glycerol-3-phosphate acyltransferase PlsY